MAIATIHIVLDLGFVAVNGLVAYVEKSVVGVASVHLVEILSGFLLQSAWDADILEKHLDGFGWKVRSVVVFGQQVAKVHDDMAIFMHFLAVVAENQYFILGQVAGAFLFEQLLDDELFHLKFCTVMEPHRGSSKVAVVVVSFFDKWIVLFLKLRAVG